MSGHKVARPSQVRTYLRRHSAFGDVPEGRVMIDVIVQAWTDAGSRINEDKPDDARAFFVDGRAASVADAVGFVGDVAQLFRDHGPAPRAIVQPRKFVKRAAR
jgi:hypothetical protein